MTERILGEPGPKRHRRLTAARMAALLGTLTAFLVVFVAASGAQLPGSTFESNDGNLSIQTAGQKDWNSYADGSALATADNFALKVDDGFEYAGGMKHDDACPSLNGPAENVQTKSDFTRMYIAYEDVGDTFLYLAWQRVVQNSTSNSAHASFIFAQSALTGAGLCPNGQTPVRTAGDMLITFDFFGGAGDATVALSRWITSGAGSLCESNYQTMPAAGCWGDVTTFAATVGHGAVNTRTNNSPAECVVSKNPLGAVLDAIPNPDKCLGELEFGEAAVNLTDAGVFDSSTDCVSFGSVHVGSRASGNSFDAQLKDLLRPLPIELTNCAGIKITKTDDEGTPLEGVTFTLHLEDEENPGEPGDSTGLSCTTDEDGECTIEEVLPGDYCVVESNLPDGYDPDPDLPYCFTIEEGDVDTTIELPTFENPRQLHRVIVLVCHEADDTLYPSDVTIDEVTKTSLDNTNLTEAQENALCELGGASFDGFGHEEVDATIDIASH